MSRLRQLLFSVFILCAALSFGQRYEFEKIGLEEGLPTTAINNMVEGPEGFIWMASEGAGLLRYDGYRFESFFQESFPLILEVTLSWRQGKVLYIRNNQKLAEFDGGKTFKEIPVSESEILDFIDVEGRLYLAAGRALYYWDGDSAVFKADLPDDFKRLTVLNGKLYAASRHALYEWEENWNLIDRHPQGISFIEGEKNFYLAGGDLKSIEDSGWQELLIDSVYYATASDSASAFLGSDRIELRIGSKTSLIPYQAYFTRDQVKRMSLLNGQLIIHTTQGLFKLKSPALKHYPRKLPILSLNSSNGSLLLGTPLGLERWPDQDRIEVQGLVLDSRWWGDTLFIATESGLLFREKKADAPLQRSPVEGFVFTLVIDSEGSLWAASSSGIWSLNPGGVWRRILSDEDLNYATIFGSRSTSNKHLWFASYTQGIWRYDGADWANLRSIGGIALDSIGISSMCPLSNSRIAIGTLSNGLYLLDLVSNSHQHFSLKDLEYAEVRDLALYEDQLWLGTNKGSLALEDIRQSKRAGESAQLHFWGTPVNGNSFKIEGSTLYTAGEQGLFVLDLADLERGSALGNCGVLHADFLQGSSSVQSSSFAYQAYSGLKQLGRLEHDQNYLRFRYGIKGLFFPQLVQYRYRLKGLTENWTYAGTNREALFSDLKAGDYHFQVEARYPWQTWEIQAADYNFKIQEAVWRTWWFWTIIGTISLVLAYIFLQDRWRRQKERLSLENDLLEMERKALRLQMNPHFIFNALDSISSFIFKKDPKMAVRYLNNFAKLMRLTLESSMEHIHPVETEVSILKNYLELEKLRFSGKFDYQIELDEELDYTIGLPPMLIQPHVENAILHGLKPKEGPGMLNLSFVLDGEILCCTIEDDGIGREKARELPNKKAHRSMATKINRDRISLLKKSLDEVIDLKIIDKYNQQGEPSGTKVIIRLPAQEL